MKIFTTIILLFSLLFSIDQVYAQTGNISVSGKLIDESGRPLTNVMLSIRNTRYTAETDTKGHFTFYLPTGTYTIEVKLLGYKTYEKQLNLKESMAIGDIQLISDIKNLDEIQILGKTEGRKVKEQPFYVSSVETKKYANTSADLNQILNRTSGVRIRENGGVGSNFNFSLNGFSGNQIRFFIDGIPMDNLGSSFQVNNIPVNVAERIDIYKGVVPISLGSDALGGAINIITNPNRENYFDASYSYGSFNTHRSSVNLGYTTKSGFTTQLNVFQNYSDNNYKVNVEVADLVTGLYTPMRVNRFHDRYHNETIIAKVGMANKSYADLLLVGVTLGKNEADIQTGNRMFDVYGGRERNGTIIMPSVTYQKKDLFVKGLDWNVKGNFNLGTEQTIDTLFRQYNWLGDFVYKGSDPAMAGGENSRTLYKFRNNNGLAISNMHYQWSSAHQIDFNYTFNTFDRKGKDELNPNSLANEMPKKSAKHFFGASYNYQLADRFTAMAFVKEYLMHSQSSRVYNQEYFRQSNDFNYQGYGAATAYFIKPDLQVKASYEKSVRLPENEEMFGDEINLASNYNLRPERGDNFNAGVAYRFKMGNDHQFNIESNGIYRNTTDFIRAQVAVSGDRAKKVNVNMGKVLTRGADAELRYSYQNKLTATVNATYQNIINNTEADGPVYKDRIPNIPYFYGNTGLSYKIDQFGGKGNSLRIDYNLLYVHEYFLRWPSQGAVSSKDVIPQQVAHDAALIYSMQNGKYNVSLDCRNLTDAMLYDNFSLQKPSRSFNLKLRYYLSNF